MILSGCLPVFPLLPTVAVPAVADFFAAVQEHGAALRSANKKEGEFLHCLLFCAVDKAMQNPEQCFTRNLQINVLSNRHVSRVK